MRIPPQINVVALVDVIGALSERTLHNGNLSIVDDGPFHSTSQGTPELVTRCQPGETIHWSALAVDVQTPVEIRSITFLGPSGANDATDGSEQADYSQDSEKLVLDSWSGVVPAWMAPGIAYRYRLELQMYEGKHSVLHVDSPALMRA